MNRLKMLSKKTRNNPNQGRLARMDILTKRRLVGSIGLIAVLGLVFLSAYGAAIDCDGQFHCVGTESDDTIRDNSDTAEIRGLGGDDTIIVDSGTPGDRDKQVFGGTGNDRIDARPGNDSISYVLFGDDGDDFIRLDQSRRFVVDGGRGNDTILVADDIDEESIIKDGPGRDAIRGDPDEANPGYTIRLDGDNEQDTVLLYVDNANAEVVISLARDGGRDVIRCTDPNDDDPTPGGTILLNGNRKAVDPQGNNLFRAARLGGVAQTGCATIIP